MSMCVSVSLYLCESRKNPTFPQPQRRQDTETKPRGSSIHPDALQYLATLTLCLLHVTPGQPQGPWGAQGRSKGPVKPKRLRKHGPTATAAPCKYPTLMLKHIQPRCSAGAEPAPASPPCSAAALRRSLWSQPGGSGSEAGAQSPVPASPSPGVTALSPQAPNSPVLLTKVHRDVICKRDSWPRRLSPYRARSPSAPPRAGNPPGTRGGGGKRKSRMQECCS